MRVLQVGVATSNGLVRDHNEDAYLVSDRIFAVCDGMGGHKAGEVASELAVRVFKEYSFTNKEPLTAVTEAILLAHRVVQHEAQAPEFNGMGTTATLALIDQREQKYYLYIGHVGDSRAYVLHHNHLVQVTSDHSLVGELVRNGNLTKDEAQSHPHRHIVTQALGIAEISIETFTTQLQSQDQVLLCTDGLTDVVKDDCIQAVLLQHPPQEAAQKLVDLANQYGGPDNITVIVVKIP